MPARSSAVACTNTSLPPSSGWMKPKPFWALKNFTIPFCMELPFHTYMRACATIRARSLGCARICRKFWKEVGGCERLRRDQPECPAKNIDGRTLRAPLCESKRHKRDRKHFAVE